MLQHKNPLNWNSVTKTVSIGGADENVLKTVKITYLLECTCLLTYVHIAQQAKKNGENNVKWQEKILFILKKQCSFSKIVLFFSTLTHYAQVVKRYPYLK